MATRRVLLAKLTPPRLHAVARRERLFRELDQLRKRHPVIWISGQPGAGKTALVASYLEARKQPPAWCELDAGDSDPATFFHYLSLGAASGRKRALLPHLTPELMGDLEGFSHRFFRALGAALPPRGALVLDDFHLLAEDSPVRRLVAGAATELGSERTLFIISRSPPPATFTRLLANRALAQLDGASLRLTPAEARQLAPAGLPEAAFTELERLADGWAAGLVLMLGQRHPLEDTPPRDGHRLFEYFAHQVFAEAGPALQHFWLTTSFLPHLTATMAVELTGDPAAGAQLETLYRRHLFLDRRSGGAEPRFVYHALFRAFLRAEAARQLAPEQRKALAQKAGALLEAAGLHDQAVEGFLEAGAFDELARLICTAAPTLLMQGRNQLLLRWCAQVPPAAVTSWLLYWQAAALLPFQQLGARALFEQAHAAFLAANEVLGALLACVGVLESFSHEFNAFKPADPWIAAFDDEVARLGPALTPALECRLLSALQTIQVRRPQSPSLDDWFGRALRLSRTAELPHQRLLAAQFCLSRSIWLGDLHTAQRLVSEQRQTAHSPEVPAVVQMLWRFYQAILEWQRADHESAERTLQEIHELARSSGIGFLEFITFGARTYVSLSAQSLPESRALLARMEPLLNPGRLMDVNYLANLTCGAELLGGNAKAALHWARVSFDSAQSAGAPFNAAIARTVLGHALIANDDPESARQELTKSLAFAGEMKSSYVQWLALVALALCELAAGRRAAAHAALREAFAMGRERGLVNCHPFWSPRGMALLCAEALREQIEPDYARLLIRARDLAPPSPEVPQWPWELELQALGRLRIFEGGVERTFTGKAQQKPLELLKVLIALGGRAVSMTRLITALWPDAEGDRGRTLLEVNLHRLRKLLGVEQAIAVNGGKVSLDERRCWVDVWAFERHCAGVLEPRPAALASLEAQLAKLNELYGDDLLADDEDEATLLRPRDRLAERYAQAVLALGDRLSDAGAHQAAATAYQAAIDRQPGREEFYRRLMLSFGALGRPAEAQDVYRRCQKNLAALTRTAPSLVTERLLLALRQQ